MNEKIRKLCNAFLSRLDVAKVANPIARSKLSHVYHEGPRIIHAKTISFAHTHEQKKHTIYKLEIL